MTENNTPNCADAFFVPTSLFVDQLTLNITSATPPTAPQTETGDKMVDEVAAKKQIPHFEKEGNVYHFEDFFRGLQKENRGNGDDTDG